MKAIAPGAGLMLGASVGREDDQVTVAKSVDALTPGSPQTIVQLLHTGTESPLVDFVSNAFREQAEENGATVSEQLRVLLGEVLAEPEDDWGVANRV